MSVEVKAQNTLSMTSVKAIKDATDEANSLLDSMRQSAIDAGTTLDGIYQDAMDAQTSADKAQASADSASEYASRAYANLSTVQNITETLNWIAQHGTMTLTSDVALDPTHIYFVVDAQGDYVVNGTHYAVVTEPDIADIGTYYELSIDESLNNYVATHLAVDSEGLWIIPEANGNKVLIATGSGSTYTTAGTYIIDSTDDVNAKFLADRAQIGNDDEAHLLITPERQTFYHSNGTRQAVKISKGQVVVGNDGTKQHEIWQELSQYGLSSYYNQFVNTAKGLAYIGVYADEKSKSWNISQSISTNISTPFTSSTIYFYWAGASGEALKLGGVFIAGTASTLNVNGITITYDGSTTFTANISPTGTMYAFIEYITTAPSGVLDIGYNNSGTGREVGRIGIYLLTNGDFQTAIGKYNISDSNSTYAFIIGNGTASNARSNALTVDWSGNVDIPSGAKYKINGTALSASDVGAIASSDIVTSVSSSSTDTKVPSAKCVYERTTPTVIQAHGSGNVSTTSGAITQIPLVTTDAVYNNTRDAEIDTTLGGIKIKTAGIYRVYGSIYFTNASGVSRAGVYLYQSTNGGNYASAVEIHNSLMPSSASISNVIPIASKLISCAVNDVVYLAGRALGGSSTLSGNNRATYLCVEKVGE